MDDHCHAVILAGGRGARFWPRSRIARPKQLLAPLGGRSLLRRTFERVRKIIPSERIWVVSSESLVAAVETELPELSPARIIGEPVQRNTAPAIGLAAALLLHEDRDAVMGVFPADHHIADETAYCEVATRALEAARGDRLLVLGIPPTSPETGYGYIEFPAGTRPGSPDLLPVTRFREKPDLASAKAFVAAGNFFWNSGQFFWRAEVLAEEMTAHLPGTWATVAGIARGGTAGAAGRLAARYADCENISVDHAVLERSGRVAGFATGPIGWTDLGSWNALYAMLPKDPDGNCARSEAVFVDAAGNFVDAPGKQVALLGVSDLIVVDTPDALLVCPRDSSEGIRSLLETLRSAGRDDLL